jgi:hypothetical protein
MGRRMSFQSWRGSIKVDGRRFADAIDAVRQAATAATWLAFRDMCAQFNLVVPRRVFNLFPKAETLSRTSPESLSRSLRRILSGSKPAPLGR